MSLRMLGLNLLLFLSFSPPALAQSSTEFESPVRFEAAVTSEIKDQFNSDLQMFFSIQGSGQSPLNQQVYGQMSGEAYRVWFTGRIYSVGIETEVPDGVVAMVEPELFPNQIRLTKLYIGGVVPQAYRLGVLLHEARHTEDDNGFWMHAICPKRYADKNGKPIRGIFSRIPLAKKPACDERLLGSYGIQTIFYANLARYCTNCTEKMRSDAELYALDNLQRIINKEAHDEIAKDLGLSE